MTSLFSIDLACANPEKGKQCSHKVMVEEKPKTTGGQIDLGLCQKWPTTYLQRKLSHCKFQTRDAQPDLSSLEALLPLEYWELTNLYSGRSRIVAFRWLDVITCHLTPGFYALSCKSVLDQLEFQGGDTFRAELLILSVCLPVNIVCI